MNGKPFWRFGGDCLGYVTVVHLYP
jgi:hypothetical protein